MNANLFNICPTCTHITTCVLTELKEKVWSCSEYDEATPETHNIVTRKPKRELELV